MANGEVNYDKPEAEEGQYPPGTRATYTCDEGFIEKDHTTYAFCYTWGSWGSIRFTCIGM